MKRALQLLLNSGFIAAASTAIAADNPLGDSLGAIGPCYHGAHAEYNDDPVAKVAQTMGSATIESLLKPGGVCEQAIKDPFAKSITLSYHGVSVPAVELCAAIQRQKC